MIESLKWRIRSTELDIERLESKKESNDFLEGMNSGMLIAYQSKLKDLKELLITAQELERLEKEVV